MRKVDDIIRDLNGVRNNLNQVYMFHELGHETRLDLQTILRQLVCVAIDVQEKLKGIKVVAE